jgi:4-hydroxy-tetrahydrodipicolinate synthase
MGGTKLSSLSERLGRVLLPLVTPFGDDGAIDHEKAAALAQMVIERGYCDSIIVGGTTGEFYALTLEERTELFRTLRRAVPQKVPLIAGTGAPNTDHAIMLTRAAEEIGYTVAMVVAPYYSKPTQQEIATHFERVAASTKLPIMLYNIPLFTGVNIDPATVVRLAQVQNIVAIKEEAGINPTQTSEYVLQTPPDFDVYCGDDTMVIATLGQGAVGVVSGGSHVIGDMMKQMIAAYFEGQVEVAKELHLKLFGFFKALGGKGRVNPIPVLRAAISMTWHDVGPPRAPQLPADEDERKVLSEVLRTLGKL